jgi:FAD/FMN-containing dehydrogenase
MQPIIDILGRDNVLSDPAATNRYLTDWRGRFTGQADAVVTPTTIEQIQQLVLQARKHGYFLTPQGGNTSLVGGATPLRDGRKNIVVSLEKMNRIIAIDPINRSAEVQTGVILAALQDQLAAERLQFPLQLTPRERVQIGGAIASNAGGLNVLRYGMMRDMVLGVEAVLGTGEIYRQMRPLRKNNLGLAVGELLLGSEGTLGIITSAQLRLFPKAPHQQIFWLGLPDFTAAQNIYQLASQHWPDGFTACEYMNRESLRVLRDFKPNLQEEFALRHPHYLLLQFEGESIQHLRELATTIAAKIPTGAEIFHTSRQHEAETIWSWRKSIPAAEKNQGYSVKTDLSLPLSAWPDFLSAAETALRQVEPDLQIVALGHLGDGNLHFNLRPKDIVWDNYDAYAKKFQAVIYPILDRLNGSPAAEHGVGQLRRDEATQFLDPAARSLMRRIKAVFDPDGIMNPGKVV